MSDSFYGYPFLSYSAVTDSNSLTNKCLFFPTWEEVRRNEDPVIISAMACLSCLKSDRGSFPLFLSSESKEERMDEGWTIFDWPFVSGRRRFYQKSPSPDFHFDLIDQNHASFTYHLTMSSCKGNSKGKRWLSCFYVVCLLSHSDAESCLTFCSPMDCNLSGSSVHGILQARILEWVASSFSRESSQLRDRTLVSHIAGRFFTV